MSSLQGLTLSYPGWEDDRAEAEQWYVNYSSAICDQKLVGMKNKQRLFEGDRTHPQILALDAAEFTYDGWEADKEAIEKVHIGDCCALRIGCFDSLFTEMKRKQAMHNDRSSIDFLRQLDDCTFTYTGWEVDKAEAEKWYIDYTLDICEKKLVGMKNKQRLFDGDRTHPQIQALDTAEFTYDGWKDDKEEAEKVHTGSCFPLRVGCFDDMINKMKKKQAVHSDRSSVEFLRDLDESTFDYTGWEDDKAIAEQWYIEFSAALCKKKLTGMKNRQRIFDGDRSHPDIVTLDTAEFSYDGWHADKEEAEKVHIGDCHALRLGCFSTVFEEMVRKQAIHSGRSSVGFLRDLDAVSSASSAFASSRSNSGITADSQTSETEPTHESSEMEPSHETTTSTGKRLASAALDDESGDDTTKCSVCWDCAPSHAFIPCGHLCICALCASRSNTNRGGRELKCPLCRKRATSITKIYF